MVGAYDKKVKAAPNTFFECCYLDMMFIYKKQQSEL